LYERNQTNDTNLKTYMYDNKN